MYTGICLGEPEGKSSIARPGHRWEDNTIMNFKGVEWETETEFIWFRIGTSDRLL
jgi:hypothetical protein